MYIKYTNLLTEVMLHIIKDVDQIVPLLQVINTNRLAKNAECKKLQYIIIALFANEYC